MSRNDDYTTGNLLDFSYHQNYYKLVGIDLSRQANTSIPQQINFVGKLEEDDGETMFLLLKCNIKMEHCQWQFKFKLCCSKEITYNTKLIFKSNLCGYNDTYILVRGDITVVAAPTTQVAFKNCAPFTNCITKIDGTIVDMLRI